MLFIFDMGGVVTNTFEMDSLYSSLGIHKTEFFELCRAGNKEEDIWHLLQTGKICVNEFWAMFNQKTNGTKIPQVKSDLFRLYFHPILNTETAKLISDLRIKNRVICGTNTIQSHWENHLERGDYALFDQTYASNKIGLAKPDPEFFKTILTAEGGQAENTFFVDDRIENVEAAKSIGINAVQFTTAKALIKAWKKYI